MQLSVAAINTNRTSNTGPQNILFITTITTTTVTEGVAVVSNEFSIVSGAISVVYVLIGIREIRQTQLNTLLYSFIKATCFDPLKRSSSGRG
jgi:hypothetical protein